jgi:hypothetical protein
VGTPMPLLARRPAVEHLKTRYEPKETSNRAYIPFGSDCKWTVSEFPGLPFWCNCLLHRPDTLHPVRRRSWQLLQFRSADESRRR